MQTAREEYLEHAARVEKLAAQERDIELKNAWLDIARSYRRVAAMDWAETIPSRIGITHYPI